MEKLAEFTTTKILNQTLADNKKDVELKNLESNKTLISDDAFAICLYIDKLARKIK